MYRQNFSVLQSAYIIYVQYCTGLYDIRIFLIE